MSEETISEEFEVKGGTPLTVVIGPKRPDPEPPALPPDLPRTVYFTDRRCPECGSSLLSNGPLVWCSHVGSHRPAGPPACDFGIAEKVRPDDPRIAPAQEVRP